MYEWEQSNLKIPTVNSESLRLQVTQKYNGLALRLTNEKEVARDGGCFYHAIIHGLG